MTRDAGRLDPADPAFDERVRESFGRQAVMRMLGAEIVHVSPGEVHIALPFRGDLTQQHGFLHAGIVATILDSACGYAAFSLMPRDAGVLSVEYKINLLAPARGDRFTARGTVVRPGRTLTTVRGGVFAADAAGVETRVAEMLGTMMTVRDREGIRG